MNPGAINWEIETKLERATPEVLARVHFNYRTSTGELQRDSSYIIRLPRIAANLGYGKPQIEETRYTGEFRNIPATRSQLSLSAHHDASECARLSLRGTWIIDPETDFRNMDETRLSHYRFIFLIWIFII